MTKICMLAYTYYLSDPRVRREAEALADKGYLVDVMCLRGQGEPSRQEIHGVRLIRLPQGRYRGHQFLAYVAGYIRFFILSFLWLSWRHLKERYGLIQIHTMPDFLIFSAVVPKILGAKIVLDIHDLMPELYCSKFGLSEDHPFIKALTLQERLSARFAHRVISVHEPQRRLLVDHGIPESKIRIIMNAVDDRIFRLPSKSTEALQEQKGFTLVYHGTLVKRYGVDVAIRAMKLLEDEIPHLRFLVYGDGDILDELETLVRQLGLQNKVIFSRNFIPLEQIPSAVAQADLGLVPNRDTGRDNFLPTKLLEYVAMGIPAIVSRTDTVETYFDDSMVRFVRPGEERDLAEAVLDLYDHPEKARGMAQHARRFTEKYGWARQRSAYYQLIDTLLKNPCQRIERSNNAIQPGENIAHSHLPDRGRNRLGHQRN